MLNSHLMNSLGLSQFVIQKANALLNLPNFAHKSEDKEMIHHLSLRISRFVVLTCDGAGLCKPPSLASRF